MPVRRFGVESVRAYVVDNTGDCMLLQVTTRLLGPVLN